MPAGVKITGVEKLTASLRKLAKRHKPVSQAVVAYSAEYAAAVHEDLQAFHPNGQAKYLETAIRTTTREVSAAVRREIAAGKSMEDALLAGGAIVLDASNSLVPVDTGFLRDSGYVYAR